MLNLNIQKIKMTRFLIISVLTVLSILTFAASNEGLAGFASTGGKRRALVKCFYGFSHRPIQLTLYVDGYYQAYEPIYAERPADHIDVSGPFSFRIINNNYIFSHIETKDAFELNLSDRDAEDVLHGTWRDTRIPGAEGTPRSVTCQLSNDFDLMLEYMLKLDR